MNNIFYNASSLPIERFKQLLVDAKNVSTSFHIDKLIGYQRQNIDMSFNDVLELLDESCHRIVIYRNQFDVEGEIGFCTLKGDDIFLFIYLKSGDLFRLINKYELKVLN